MELCDESWLLKLGIFVRVTDEFSCLFKESEVDEIRNRLMSFELELNGELNGLNGGMMVWYTFGVEKGKKILTLTLEPVIEALLKTTLDLMDIFLYILKKRL